MRKASSDKALDVVRRVRFVPYGKGGESFSLVVWDTHATRGGKCVLGYRLSMGRVVLFEGADFCCSQMHSIDSDEMIAALMGFLTLRPGDTDAKYFADYTAEQLAYCAEHAEALSCEVDRRFGESE